MKRIEVFNLATGAWGLVQDATAGESRNGVPDGRNHACSVVVQARDKSSFNIYVFGGNSLKGARPYSDLWVLSIPSFRWFLLSPGTAESGAPTAREGMTCDVVGGGRKMFVYGGRKLPDFSSDCDKTGIYVFDLTTLEWEKEYNPKGGEYEVPAIISNVIGGGPYGGATLYPEKGLYDVHMKAAFDEIIAGSSQKYNINVTSTSTTSNSSAETPNKMATGTIAGIAIGCVGGLALVICLILLLRKRSRAGVDNQNRLGSVPELNGVLPPQELQALAAPQELPSAPYTQGDHRPYYEPPKTGPSWNKEPSTDVPPVSHDQFSST